MNFCACVVRTGPTKTVSQYFPTDILLSVLRVQPSSSSSGKVLLFLRRPYRFVRTIFFLKKKRQVEPFRVTTLNYNFPYILRNRWSDKKKAGTTVAVCLDPTSA